MRKYDKRNKIYMLTVMISSIILIVIFSFFIKKVITNGSLVYTIDAGSIMYDNDKNLIKIDEDGTLKIKWNDMYYLMYQEDMYSLGKNAIIYNPMKSQMNLYGKYYEVSSEGEDKVIIHEDETIVSVNESKFYKIADRKYLIIDKTIRTENNELNTTNYLIIELDKLGNALIYNNSLNLKTFKETNIIASTFTFNIAEEKLLIDGEEVDLKKIIGSTNEYVKAEDIEKEEEQREEDNQQQDNGNNITDNGNNNPGGNQGGTGTGEGTTGGTNDGAAGDGTGQGNGTGGTTGGDNSGGGTTNEDNNKEEDDDKLTDSELDNLIQTTKTTSIISVTSSVGYVNIDYVIYDPLDEYEAVYVELYDSNNNLVAVSYFDKTTNNLVIPGLRANVTYNLIFKYLYYDEDGKRVEEKFDEASVMMGSPEVSLKVNKVTSNRIYYTLYLDNEYTLDSVKVNLTSTTEDGNINLSNTIDSANLSSNNSVDGYFEYDKIGKYVTLYLSDVQYKGYLLDVDISHKIAMP